MLKEKVDEFLGLYPMAESSLGYLEKSVKELEEEKVSLEEDMSRVIRELEVLEETKNILAIINDTNTNNTLTFINGVINRVLGQMFPTDPVSISIEKSLYANKHVHLNVKLTDKEGNVRDMKLQSGTGLKQVVSFLFRVSLIELRGGRRVLFADEILNGVHQDAKGIIMDIMKIFAEEGFQFIVIEHGGFTEYGKLYNVEKIGNEANLVEIEERDEFDGKAFVG